jgi:hypothetical protein
MMTSLVGVIETRPYLAEANRLMSEEERLAVVDMVAGDPEAGAVVPGTGGLRKMRIRLEGRGKRGGGRVIYWYHSRVARWSCYSSSPRTRLRILRLAGEGC